MEKKKPSYTVGGSVIWYRHNGKWYAGSSKTINRITIWSRNSIPGSRKKMKIIWKDTGTIMFITALFTTAKAWEQPKCPSGDDWLKTIWNTHTHTHTHTHTPHTHTHTHTHGFLGGSLVQNPPAKQETQVWSLDQEEKSRVKGHEGYIIETRSQALVGAEMKSMKGYCLHIWWWPEVTGDIKANSWADRCIWTGGEQGPSGNCKDSLEPTGTN